jgi:hypothetical protein
LHRDSTGGGNTAVGYCALFENKTGYENTACGLGALNYNTSGSNNTAMGMRALNYNTTGYYNTASGFYALYNNVGGNYNTAMGAGALNYNDIGNNNTACGFRALLSDTSGSDNEAFGHYAGYQITNGNHNTCIGGFTGNSYNFFSSTFLGNSAGPDNNDYSNCMALGYGATVDASDKVMIGNSEITSIGGYAGWTTFLSDEKQRKDVSDNVPGLTFINLLRPVTYHVDVAENKSGIVYSGFIAQEVEAAAKSVNYDFSGIDVPKNPKGPYGLRYAEFVVPLVKAVQEQQEIIEGKQEQIKVQQQQIDDLIQRVENLENGQ